MIVPRCLARLLPLVLPGLACTLPAGKLGDVVEEGSTAEGGEELPPESERVAVLALEQGALDVLLVVDNSGSMGAEQADVAQAVVPFVESLISSGSDVRVGVTTTDNGNPWCQGTGPEAGQLRLSACTTRPTEFIFQGSTTIDAFDEACADLCSLESLPIVPTVDHMDPTMAARPWLEISPGGTNLDGGVAYQDALACAIPQGIDGCGFESPLESMNKLLGRAKSPSDPSYGFLRPWARLMVVLVTDEVDCSVDSAYEEIFLPDGNQVFWSDPDAPAPTSAVCWNAGVECQNEEGDLGACNPQNYDVEGNVTDASSAVMVSLTRYIEALEAVEASKAAYLPDGSVGVMVIAGVPPGYYEDEAELSYTRSVADPQFLLDFGVGPGCSSSSGQAVPPVRLRALAELFTIGGRDVVDSICNPDFAAPFALAADAMGTPRLDTVACVPGCLTDLDTAAAGTQVQCEVVMSRASETGRESVLLPRCGGDEPAEACYRLRLDADAAACAEQGSNAQLELVLPEGTPVQGQLTVEAACEMAPAGSC